MLFLIMITLGTLLIASAAIYFSVLGLTQTFSETALYWGIAIEVAKLVLASFVYRYWNELKVFNKCIGVFFIGMLMVITSLGISGHILSSMQQNDLELSSQGIQVQAVENSVSRTQDRINFLDQRITQSRDRLQAIDEEISQVPNNFVTARRELIQERQPEKDQIQELINELFDEREALFLQLETSEIQLSELSLETEQIEVKVGPIVKVVETFGAEASVAVYLFILLIVLSFDPVAVYLTISANKVAIDVRLNREQKKKEKEELENSELGTNEPTIEDIETLLAGRMEHGDHGENEDKLKQIADSIEFLKNKVQKDEEKKQQFRDSLS